MLRTTLAIAFALTVTFGSWSAEAPDGAAETSSSCVAYTLKDIRLGMSMDDAKAVYPGAKVKELKRLGDVVGRGRAWVIKKDYLKKHAEDPVYVIVILDEPNGQVVSISTQYTVYGGMAQPVASQVPNEVLLDAFIEKFGEPDETRPFDDAAQQFVWIDQVTTEAEGSVHSWEDVDCGVVLQLKLGQSRSSVGTYAYSKTETISPIQSATLSTLSFAEESKQQQQGKVKL